MRVRRVEKRVALEYREEIWLAEGFENNPSGKHHVMGRSRILGSTVRGCSS